MSGRAQALVGDNEVVDLEPWTAIRVPPETPRALRAVGDEDAIFVKIGAPNTGPGDGRGVPTTSPGPTRAEARRGPGGRAPAAA